MEVQVRKPKLLEQLRNMIRTKHYSIRTEEDYINWIKKYILFHKMISLYVLIVIVYFVFFTFCYD